MNADISMCGFIFSVTFYCVSHLYRLFPRVRAYAFDEYGSDSFTGVRPLAMPQDAAPPLCPLASSLRMH